MTANRFYKKVITRMPSGRFVWNILDRLENRVAGGLARSYREARKRAREAQTQQSMVRDKRILATPAYSMRNQMRNLCRGSHHHD